jgi:hypothetical protein
MGDDGGNVEPLDRRDAIGLAVAAATVLVFLLCCVGHANPGDYVMVDRILARPWFATWLLAISSTAATLVLFRTWAARTVTLLLLLLPAVACLAGQWFVAPLDTDEHKVLATSPDGTISVVAYAAPDLIDENVRFTLRANAGWRSRERCLDRLPAACPCGDPPAAHRPPPRVAVADSDLSEAGTRFFRRHVAVSLV